MSHLILTVTDMTGKQLLRPVTGGVPIVEGTAPADTYFALLNAEGQSVPVQTTVLARWRDGSARWVLLDFQAAPSANSTSRYTLIWGAGVEAAAPPVAVGTREDTIASGEMRVAIQDGNCCSSTACACACPSSMPPAKPGGLSQRPWRSKPAGRCAPLHHGQARGRSWIPDRNTPERVEPLL